MGEFSTAYKRSFLMGLVLCAKSAGKTVKELLEEAIRSGFKKNSEGLYLVGTSSNGASVSFSVPPADGITPEKIFVLVGWLYELYLKYESLYESEDEVIEAIKKGLKPVSSVVYKFGGFRR